MVPKMSSKSSTFPLYESEDCKHLSPSLTRIIDGIIAKIDSLLKKVSASSEYSLPSSQRDCLEKIRNYLKNQRDFTLCDKDRGRGELSRALGEAINQGLIATKGFKGREPKRADVLIHLLGCIPVIIEMKRSKRKVDRAPQQALSLYSLYIGHLADGSKLTKFLTTCTQAKQLGKQIAVNVDKDELKRCGGLVVCVVEDVTSLKREELLFEGFELSRPRSKRGPLLLRFPPFVLYMTFSEVRGVLTSWLPSSLAIE